MKEREKKNKREERRTRDGEKEIGRTGEKEEGKKQSEEKKGTIEDQEVKVIKMFHKKSIFFLLLYFPFFFLSFP